MKTHNLFCRVCGDYFMILRYRKTGCKTRNILLVKILKMKVNNIEKVDTFSLHFEIEIMWSNGLKRGLNLLDNVSITGFKGKANL